jgi:aminodeoxychorismate synthase component I
MLEDLEIRLPFWRYYALHHMQPYSFLLDSASDPGKLGRFSFMGSDPYLVYKAKRQHGRPAGTPAKIEVVERRAAGGKSLDPPRVTRREADPFEDLRAVQRAYAIDLAQYDALPVPFLSGAVGYFGYEAGYFVEDLPDLGADDLGLPDIYFLFVDAVMAHCHETGKSYLSIVGRGANTKAARQSAEHQRDQLLARIEAFESDPPPEWTGPDPERAARTSVPVHAHFDEAGYCRVVEKAKEHIFAGDIFEVCTTHRLESPLVGGDPWDLYQELRRINPAPFAAFLDLPEAQIVSSSPERFLRLGRDRVAESRPIKGTRPRGKTPEEDERNYHDLFSSVKDRAENVMIVDLVRNDFGRVCEFHSVHVPELMIVEKYATVFQMVSTVRGKLREGLDGLDLIKACFPGGSMTGAPKIEALKIIDRLEPVKRGVYSGAIGYLDGCGSLDLNIVIRTLVVKNGRCYFNVGGAIVADSDPHAEYCETQDKARALITALGNLRACGSERRPRR